MGTDTQAATYDVTEDETLAAAVRGWLEAKSARDEWDEVMSYHLRTITDHAPDWARRFTLAGQPAVTLVVPGPRSVLDRTKFSGDFPGLLERYTVPGAAPRPFLRRA